MTLWKPALGLALTLGLSACVTITPAPTGTGVTAAPVVGRAARTPGALTETDIVRAVMSSL